MFQSGLTFRVNKKMYEHMYFHVGLQGLADPDLI